MSNYTLKPYQSTNYVWLFFGIFFLVVTIGTVYVLAVLVPEDANLPKSTYAIVLLFLAITGYSFFKVKQQNGLSKINLTTEGLTYNDTNKSVLWKNISDLYLFSTGKVLGLANNLAYRTSENEPFTHISAMQYDIDGLEKIQEFYINPRVTEVLGMLNNGKTVTFHYIPLSNSLKQSFNISESQFLNIKTESILLNNKEITVTNKTYALTELSVIGLNNSGDYQLKTQAGEVILEFNRMNLMSAEVFRNVINQLVK